MAAKRITKKKDAALTASTAPSAELTPNPTPAAAAVAPAMDTKSRTVNKPIHRSRKATAVSQSVAETSSGDVAALASAVAIEPPASPTDEIARLAYTYWEDRGRADGFALADWLRAEQEVLSRSVK